MKLFLQSLGTVAGLAALALLVMGAVTVSPPGGGSGSATNAVTVVRTNAAVVKSGATSMVFTNPAGGNIEFAASAVGAAAVVSASVPSGATLSAVNLSGTTTASNITVGSITSSNRLFAYAASVIADGTVANKHTQTNKSTGNISLYYTNFVSGQMGNVMLRGEASGGANRTVTIYPEPNGLVKLNGMGLAAAGYTATATFTLTNGQDARLISDKTPFQGTNEIQDIILERTTQ